jgi:putative GTP pyrophosphokinase
MRKKQKVNSSSTDELAEKYATARPRYEAFTNNIAQLLATLLNSTGIEYLAIEPRTKSIDSFKAKIVRPVKQGKYETIDAVTDLSGVRVIAYYQKDVEAICRLIEQNFTIDSENSTDRNDTLAPDKFGYLSIHYIVSHSKEREKLAENAAFASLKVELQIRTVLQHAWAVLDRKLRYNNEEDIPRQVRRKLFRVSALLEIADENFSEVDKTVGDLRAQYTSDIKVGNFGQETSVKTLELEVKKHFKVLSIINQESFADPDMLKSVSNLVMSTHLGWN